MRGRLIFGLFGRSPFKPLHDHMMKVKECTSLIKPLFNALIEGDLEEIRRIAQEVSKTEHEADKIKNEIRSHLPKSIFLPVAREDILVFLREQDAIADATEEVALFLTLRKLRIHDGIKGPLMELVEKVLDTSDTAAKATSEIHLLFEAAFKGKEKERVLSIISEVERKKWEADMARLSFARSLFKVEKELDPTTVYLLLEISSGLRRIAHHAENACDYLRMMLSKG